MLEWFDADPSRYWTLAWLSFGSLACTAVLPAVFSLISERYERAVLRFFPRWSFVALLILSVVAFRWPMWCVTEELNPDESQIIAGAITLQHDPVYWRSVDGTTHGPIDTYALLLPRALGLSFGYGTARALGAALMMILILCGYRAVLAYGKEITARLVALLAFCFLAFVTFADFAHYSSEHVPAAMLAIGCMLLAIDLRAPTKRKIWSWRWIVAGLVLGAVPLAKLQGALIAACLLGTAALIDLFAAGIPPTRRLSRFAALFLASLAPLAATAMILGFFGLWDDAWRSYVVQNLRYAGDSHYTHAEMLRQFWSFAERGEGFYSFIQGCALVIAVCLVPALFTDASTRRLIVLSFVFLLSSLAAALAPGRQYHHYLLFLVAPASLLAGVVWQTTWYLLEKRSALAIVRSVLLAGLLYGAVWPQVSWRKAHQHPYVGYLAHQPRPAKDPVAIEVLRYAHHGEPLALWGWMGRYYVYTGLRQATREAHTVLEIQWTPQMAYFRQRLLADLERSRPPVFVDAVGPKSFVFQDRSLAHESFPALAEFIAKNYTLASEIDGCRIFVRLDRLKRS